MSTDIEQRIVEMKFDNKGFESGVKDTLDQLDKLDKAAKFEGSSDSFRKLQNAADSVQFNKLIAGIDSISGSLENMQSFGFQVFERLSSRAADMMANTVKSLSVDQISGGFKEYELKMDSVRTIMNSSGESLETVNKYLQELNEYSDKTIYSFSDMTSSIGKFTNAGVKLDDAVLAIQGISNEAAVSGANAQQASQAMYNFAQALSSGSVKLIDWKSIETANMATVEFKNELLKTAVALGTVKEVEGGYISTTTDANGKVSDLFTSTLGFNDALSSQWMTTDVLVQTLGRYADETTEIGKKAFASAQEVTTFSKMMDALKESVGSGWAQTFEILFGDLEEGKKLWTGINNVVGGFIASVSDTRNGILEMWKAADGHTLFLQGLKDIWWIVKNIGHYVGLALETIFGHRYKQNFDDVKKFFSDREGFSGNLVTIKRMSDFLINVSKSFSDLTRKLRKYFNPNLEASRRFLEEIYQCAQAIIIPGRFIFRIVSGLAGKFLPVIFKLLGGGLRIAIHLISKIGYALTEGGLYLKLYDLADLIVNGIGGGFDLAINAILGFADTLAKILGYNDSIDMFMHLSDILSTIFFGAVGLAVSAIDLLVRGAGKLKDIAGPIFEFIGSSIQNLATNIQDFWNSNEEFQKIKNTVGEFFEIFTKPFNNKNTEKGAARIVTSAHKLIESGYDVEEAWTIARNSVKDVNGFWDLFDSLTAKSTIFFNTISQSQKLKAFTDILKQFKDSIANSAAGQAVKKFFEPLTTAIHEVFGDAKFLDFFKAFGPVFELFVLQLRSIDTSSIGSTVHGIAQAFGQLFANLKGIAAIKFSNLFKKLDELWDKLFPDKDEIEERQGIGIFESIKTVFSNGLNGIFTVIKNFKWSKVGDLLKSFTFIYVIKKIIGLFTDSKKMTGSLKDTLKSFSKVVGNFADATSMVKWQMAADALKVFAESVLKLVAAVVILALIPEDALSKALGALMMIAVIAGVVMLVKHYIIDAEESANEASTAAEAIKGFGVLIAENLKDFGKNLIKSLSKALSKAALAMLIVSIGIVVTLIVGLLERLNGLTWPEYFEAIGKLVIILGMIVGTIALFELIANKVGKNATKYVGLAFIVMSIAGSLSKMATLIEKVGEIPWDTYKSGLGKLLLTLGELLLAVFLLELINAIVPGNLTKMSTGILIMAAALSVMMIPILALAAIPEKALWKAVGALAGIAGAISILALAMGGAVRLAGGMTQFAVAILAIVGIAGGIFIFAAALSSLIAIKDDVKESAGYLIAMAAALAIFAGVMGGIGYALGGGLLMLGGGLALIGLALLFTAKSVDLFADAATKFAQNMDTIVNAVNGREEEVSNAITTIVYAAVKGVMEGLVYILAALLTGIDDALIVLDEKADSIGMHLGSSATKLAIGFVKGLLKALGEMLGFLGKWISDKILETVNYDSTIYEDKAVADATGLYGMNQQYVVPAAKDAGEEVNKAYGDSILVDEDTSLWDAFAALQSGKLTQSSEEVKAAARHSGFEVKESFGESMNDPGEGAGGRMMGKAAQEIKEKTPEVKEAASDAGDEVVEELDVTDEVTENNAMTMEFMKNLPEEYQAIINQNGSLDYSALFGGLGPAAEEGGEAAEIATNNNAQAILEKYRGMDFNSIGLEGQEELAAALQQYGGMPVDESGNITDEMIQQYIDGNYGGAGEYSDDQLAEGMENATPVVRKAGTSVARAGADAASNQKASWNSTGVGLVVGMANAITDESWRVEQASYNMVANSVTAMRKAADEHSPSKKTYQIMWFMIKGYLNACSDKGHLMADATGQATENAVDAMRNAMSKIPDIMDSDLDSSPVISPVLDSTRFRTGLRELSGALNGSYANIGARLDVDRVDIGSAVGELSAATSQGNSDLLTQLRMQAQQTERLIYLLENQKIYMDGNTVVGKLGPKFDNYLGKQAILAGGRR